ncbi:MAG TPA: hypothetical protein VGU45_05030 [Microvirga sp.]|jgi:hypothetical protein|nr:hypothetical protein [Microvirga sp.]
MADMVYVERNAEGAIAAVLFERSDLADAKPLPVDHPEVAAILKPQTAPTAQSGTVATLVEALIEEGVIPKAKADKLRARFKSDRPAA